MDTNERVIQALHEFENMTDADKVLTQELEDLFVQIAHTGRIQIPWIYLKPVFMFKMDRVMRDFFESSPSRNNSSSEPTHTAEFDVMRQRLLDCIESFTSAPFTVQRLCELMIEPKRHYKSSEKFMRGVEKNVLVVSTMTDIEGNELTHNHESTSIPNGPVTNGIITTASATEMESVDERESNGQLSEHYHDTHYPITEDLQHCNGNTEKKDIKDDTRTEESWSIDEEKASEQPSDHENKSPESEDLQTDNSSEDDSQSEQQLSEEQPSEEQTTEMAKKDVEINSDQEKKLPTCNSVEEEKVSVQECVHEELQEQTETFDKKSEPSQQEEVSSPATVNEEEPMEE